MDKDFQFMIKIALYVCVLSVFFCPIEARAANNNTADFLMMPCSGNPNDNRDDTKNLLCAGTLDGFLQGFTFNQSPKSICIPSNITGWNLRDIFVDFVRKNPEYRNQHYGSALLEALSIKYRCEK